MRQTTDEAFFQETLERMVVQAADSGNVKAEKTIADYVLEYMLLENQNEVVYTDGASLNEVSRPLYLCRTGVVGGSK